MTSLLVLRPSPPPLPQWLCDAVPYAYEEAGKAQFKAMPGVVWIRDNTAPNGRGFYRGPRDAVEIVAALLESAGVCKVRSEVRGTLGPSLDPDWQPVTSAIDLAEGSAWPRLRDYQRDGALWCRMMLSRTGGALLADEMGLGKTPQAIAAAAAFECVGQEGNRLVVCPAVVVPHWEAEIAKWALDTADYWTVTSWHKFSRQQSKLAKQQWALGIFDEAHYASNYRGGKGPDAKGSGMAKAAHAFRKAHPTLPLLALTGTPMSTNPIDLWSIVELLWPSRFGRWYHYAIRYCDGHNEDITNAAGKQITNEEGEPLKPAFVAKGISRPEELRTRLAHCMLRRTKAQVGAELPPRTRVITPVTIPTAAKRDARAASLAINLDGASKTAVAALLRNSEAFKLDAAEALARDVLASGSKPLLITTRIDSCHDLAARLGCPGVTGEDNATSRRDIIADSPCAVASIKSIETGINLTGFDVIIFVGLDWVPSRILQAESRIHRIGQDKPCTIYYLVAKGTIDEVIQDRVISRLEAFAAVTGSTGDELGLAKDLAPETEDELIAAIVAAVKQRKAA